MGIMTDNLQMINRTFVSERAEKKQQRQAKNEFKNYLSKKFYNKFYNNQKSNPDNTYSYFIDPKIQVEILKKFNDINISDKINIYNSTLKTIYKNFKDNYKMNISIENIEKEEEKRKKELEKILLRQEKILYNQNIKLQNINYKYNIQKENRQNIHKKGFAKIAGALIIGGKLASKTTKKHKW